MSAFKTADTLLPRAFDAARAARTLESLAGKGFLPAPEDLPLLNAAFGNSSYLARLALRDHEFLQTLLDSNVEESFAEVCCLADTADSAVNVDAAMAALRIAKGRAAVTTALADISGVWA